MTTRIGACLLLVFTAGPSRAGEADTSADRGRAAFEGKVRAILTDRCLACHAADKQKGGLDLTQRDRAIVGGENGAAIVPGKPEDSALYEKVAAGEMPPKNPLTADQVEAIRGWIEAGAPYAGEPLARRRAGPDWWSLRPIARPEVPKVHRPDWVRTPVDAFVLAELEAHGLAPAPDADRATMIRRASFDLIGLPPAPEEVAAFVQDPAPDALEKLVDRLLDSPHYGERWGRHWLDVVRFGESQGYEMNRLRPNGWPYRDYVIRAFNRDTPLPRFAAEQIAGDTIADGDWLTKAATGFLVGGTHDEVGNATIEGKLQQRMDDLDDMITATGTAFLGMTVHCARCHDHKFDPIAQKDYYGLQAVFAGVNHGERQVAVEPDSEPVADRDAAAELAKVDRLLDAMEPEAHPEVDRPTRPSVNFRRVVERFPAVEARGVRLTIFRTNGSLEPCVDEIEAWTAEDSPRNVALATAGGKASATSEFPGFAIHKIAHLNDGLYGNGRSWISREPNTGRATVEWTALAKIDRVVWGRDRLGQFQDRLATSYQVEIQEGAGDWRIVASSSDRAPIGAAPADLPENAPERVRLLARRADLAGRLSGSTRTLYAGTFSQPGATHLLRRGDPLQEGETVAPSGIETIAPPLVIAADAPESARREALARWIGDPANPLPARVMVNRAWHYHFGRGIVATPGDFGFNGSPPSHPALLDWLASEYRDGGYQLKPIHRLLMRSSAYRQSSRLDLKAREADRENRWLWRATPRRLEAESIRDAILTASGRLDRRMGGPGYSLWEPNANYVAVYTPKARLGPDEARRMVYQLRPRSQQDPIFGAFDCPDPAQVAPRRTLSTTALQALNLLNAPFLIDQSEAFATRLKTEAGDDPAAQARRGFLLTFGREPSETEVAASVPLIRAHGAPAFCRSLYNANEFVYIP